MTVNYTAPDGTSHILDASAAMKRHAEDGFRGKIKPLSTSPADVTVTMTGEAGTVSKIALARQSRVNAALDAAVGGKWAHTDPVYAAGSRVAALGMSNLTAEGERLAEVGDLSTNLRATADVIDAEDRKGIPFNVQNLRLDCRDKKLWVHQAATPGRALPLTWETLHKVCTYYPNTFGAIGGALLKGYHSGGFSPEETAEQFNKYIVDRWSDLERRHRSGKARRGKSVRKGDLVMWVRRTQEGEFQAYTITSPANTSRGYDGAAFLRTVADGLEDSGFYGEASYDPASTRVSFAGWMMPNHIVDLSAGDVFKAGISGGTADATNGGYHLSISAIRNLCLNLIILANESAELLRATHRANPSTVRSAVQDGLRRGDAGLDDLRREWGILRSHELVVPDGMSPKDVEKAVTSFPGTSAQVAVALMRASKSIKLPGIRRDSLVEALLQGYSAEPGETLADIVNAVSRMHTQQGIDEYQLAAASGLLLQQYADAVA